MNKHILALVANGFDMNLGRAYITHIRGMKHRIQVHSDDYRFKFSAVYDIDDIETAVDKYVLVINQIKSKAASARANKKTVTDMQ